MGKPVDFVRIGDFISGKWSLVLAFALTESEDILEEKLKEILWSFSVAGGDEKKIKKVSLSKSEKVVVVWVAKPSDGELNDFRTASLPMEVESSVDILERLRRFDVDTRSLAEAASEIDSLRSGWVSVAQSFEFSGLS